MKYTLPVIAMIAVGLASCKIAEAIPPAQTASRANPATNAETVRDLLWEKEKAVYEGRSRGDLSYYVANASPDFLAWTSGAAAPFRIDKLKADQQTMKGRGAEKLTQELLDFSLSGDTAVMYYRNHRTRLPDGTDVDQSYDNIHIWKITDGEWKILASMSRHAEDLGSGLTTARR